jgi:hypothetical protein
MADFNGTLVPALALGTGGDWSPVYDGQAIPLALGGSTPVIISRARVGGIYVLFTGSPPPGATDIVIVSQT